MIALVITAGYGNGTFNGTIKDVTLRGYDISEFIPPTVPDANGKTVGGDFGDGVNVSGDFGEGAVVSSMFGNGAIVKGKL